MIRSKFRKWTFRKLLKEVCPEKRRMHRSTRASKMTGKNIFLLNTSLLEFSWDARPSLWWRLVIRSIQYCEPLQKLKRVKSIQVLIVVESIDRYCMFQLTAFDYKKHVCPSNGCIHMKEREDETKRWEDGMKTREYPSTVIKEQLGSGIMLLKIYLTTSFGRWVLPFFCLGCKSALVVADGPECKKNAGGKMMETWTHKTMKMLTKERKTPMNCLQIGR